MTIKEKLAALRKEMAARNISAYIIPSSDFHGSEYVGDHFKARAYMSGFTGSAGTLVVLNDCAALWTDGRYFIQAAAQLEGSGIGLMKSGEPGVPEIKTFLKNRLGAGAVIGFDGRVVSSADAESFKVEGMSFAADDDLVGLVWSGRPALSAEKVWAVDAEFAGDRGEKLKRVREKLAEKNCDVLLVTAPEETAWLLGLRGNDVECTPVFLSFMLINADSAELFANESIFSEEISAALAADGIALRPYSDVYCAAEKAAEGKRVWADADRTNFSLMKHLACAADIYNKPTPIDLMKAIKSAAEQQGMRDAHIRDGVAVTKFICWLKKHVGKEKITELSASEKLLEFRKEQSGFIEPGFETIMAYGEHAAICHYAPSEATDCEILPKGLCLVDSGAQYRDGTTDITRTMVMGELTEEEKRGFTLVMKGHLRLGDARFRYGCGGGAVDYLAREPMWQRGLDYNHGTGHGVGFLLSVHEGPQRIHWNVKSKAVRFEEGMITSNEPGIYIEGKYGVRHENLVLCREVEKNEYGRFMGFENLTMVPFDRDGLDLSLMDEKEKELFNAYQKKVFDTVSPYLNEEEKIWLKAAVKPI